MDREAAVSCAAQSQVHGQLPPGLVPRREHEAWGQGCSALALGLGSRVCFSLWKIISLSPSRLVTHLAFCTAPARHR